MPRSAAEERGGRNEFLRWRSKKKDFMLAYAKGDTERSWTLLRELMLLTNRQFQKIQEDKRKVDLDDVYRI